MMNNIMIIGYEGTRRRRRSVMVEGDIQDDNSKKDHMVISGSRGTCRPRRAAGREKFSQRSRPRGTLRASSEVRASRMAR